MKKQIAALSVLTTLLMSSLSFAADAPGAAISVKNNVTRSTWLTVYNIFGSIRDSGCVNPGETKSFGGYYGPVAFKVRGEVTEGPNCGGKIIADIDKSVVVSINMGADLSVEESIQHSYYLEQHKLGSSSDEAMPAASASEIEDAQANEYAPNSFATITTRNHADKPMWVTIYNYFGSIRDSGCVNPGQVHDWTNYYGPLGFKVRAQVTEGANCAGKVIWDRGVWLSVDPISGVGVSLEKNIKGGDYFFNKD
jgi:hypothetical protein